MTSAYGRETANHYMQHDPAGADPLTGYALEDRGIPIGGIILWSGAIADIPDNWALCDGTNGTPDLRNSFVVGAGDTYSPDDTGGSATQADHTGHGAHSDHSDHTGHGAHGDHSTHATHSSHRHTAATGKGTQAGTSFNSWQQDTTPQSSVQDTAQSHDAHSAHSNNGAISSHSAHANNGAISAHGTNLPPYYALAYIMRTA